MQQPSRLLAKNECQTSSAALTQFKLFILIKIEIASLGRAVDTVVKFVILQFNLHSQTLLIHAMGKWPYRHGCTAVPVMSALKITECKVLYIPDIFAKNWVTYR